MSFIFDLEGIEGAIDQLGGTVAFLERFTGILVHTITEQSADIVRMALARYQKSSPDMLDAVKTSHEEMAGTVALTGPGAKKIEWLRQGTPPHKIYARRGKALAFQWGGGIHFYTHVNHPGTKPVDILSGVVDSVRAMAEQEASRIF